MIRTSGYFGDVIGYPLKYNPITGRFFYEKPEKVYVNPGHRGKQGKQGADGKSGTIGKVGVNGKGLLTFNSILNDQNTIFTTSKSGIYNISFNTCVELPISTNNIIKLKRTNNLNVTLTIGGSTSTAGYYQSKSTKQMVNSVIVSLDENDKVTYDGGGSSITPLLVDSYHMNIIEL